MHLKGVHASLIITQTICFIHDQKLKDKKIKHSSYLPILVQSADSILRYLISKFILVLYSKAKN